MGELSKANSAIIEQVVIQGDLSKLSAEARTGYYRAVCESVGLNPLTKPFDYIRLNGRLTLYAKKDATDQLRTLHGVSITKLERERIDDVYQVTAYAQNKDGRQDADIGIVTVKGLNGDKLANAMMKAVTKAKRRVTLSLCGLGWLDETEIETIPDAETVVVDDSGRIENKPLTASNGNGAHQPPAEPDTPQRDEAEQDSVEDNGKAEHWIDDEKLRSKFWAQVNNLGANDDLVYQELEVSSIHDFNGTIGDALNRIAKSMKQHSAQAYFENT